MVSLSLIYATYSFLGIGTLTEPEIGFAAAANLKRRYT